MVFRQCAVFSQSIQSVLGYKGAAAKFVLGTGRSGGCLLYTSPFTVVNFCGSRFMSNNLKDILRFQGYHLYLRRLVWFPYRTKGN